MVTVILELGKIKCEGFFRKPTQIALVQSTMMTSNAKNKFFCREKSYQIHQTKNEKVTKK